MFYYWLAPLGKQSSSSTSSTTSAFGRPAPASPRCCSRSWSGRRSSARLRAHKVGQVIRAEGPASHQGKRGTPTMGGLIILLCDVVPTLLWAPLDNRFVSWRCWPTLWMGGIGFLDDYLKIVQGKSRGLVAKWKLAGPVRLRACARPLPAVSSRWSRSRTIPATATTLPFFKYLVVNFAPLALRGVRRRSSSRACSNAVNLTDGLDGLATGLTAIAAAAFAIFAYLFGRVDSPRT